MRVLVWVFQHNANRVRGVAMLVCSNAHFGSVPFWSNLCCNLVLLFSLSFFTDLQLRAGNITGQEAFSLLQQMNTAFFESGGSQQQRNRYLRVQLEWSVQVGSLQ
jgi:hypothetical protein